MGLDTIGGAPPQVPFTNVYTVQTAGWYGILLTPTDDAVARRWGIRRREGPETNVLKNNPLISTSDYQSMRTAYWIMFLRSGDAIVAETLTTIAEVNFLESDEGKRPFICYPFADS